MTVETERKGWAVLVLKKGLAAVPYIVDLAFLLACGGLVMLGADMYSRYGGEMKELIDAGLISESLYYYPASYFMMLFGAMLIMFRFKRR